jgi:hypothetical protein
MGEKLRRLNILLRKKFHTINLQKVSLWHKIKKKNETWAPYIFEQSPLTDFMISNVGRTLFCGNFISYPNSTVQ